MPQLLVYGATGYTGRLITSYARSLGMNFLIAGRSQENIKRLAETSDLKYRIFDTAGEQNIDDALGDVSVLLNCAGPFFVTAKPLIEACIRNCVHYLDTAAELDSYRISENQEEEAKRQNIMLLPGCGGSVTMLGFLARSVFGQGDPLSSIDIALHVSGPISRGSAISAKENLVTDCWQRVDGVLQREDVPKTAIFNFADSRGDVECHQITLPDIITLWKSTGVKNIRTFINISGVGFPSGNLESLPDGPTLEQREDNPYSAAIHAVDKNGSIIHGVLRTINGYTFTSIAAVHAAKRVMVGEAQPGFQTTASLFGSDFIEAIPETVIEVSNRP